MPISAGGEEVRELISASGCWLSVSNGIWFSGIKGVWLSGSRGSWLSCAVVDGSVVAEVFG